MATQQDLDIIRKKAESGNPLSMYEYGRAILDSNPSDAIHFLENALSKGISDAGIELANHFYGKDNPRALSYCIESMTFDHSLLDNILISIIDKGNDSLLDAYVEKCNSILDDSDVSKAKLTYIMSRLYNGVKRNPDRFPGHFKDNEKLAISIDDEINGMITEGLWSDPDIYKWLDQAIDWLGEKNRKKTSARLNYIVNHNGEEPVDLDVKVDASECLLYLGSSSIYAEKLEKYALEGRIPLDDGKIKRCEKYRLSWLLSISDIETDIETEKIPSNWASKDELFDVGLRYLMMGHHHFVARLALYLASKEGNADAMFYLGYMIRMNLGDYMWSEMYHGLDYSDTIYHFVKPGDEQSGIEWIEEAVRKGSESAKDYLIRLSETGDIEATFALKRLNL